MAGAKSGELALFASFGLKTDAHYRHRTLHSHKPWVEDEKKVKIEQEQEYRKVKTDSHMQKMRENKWKERRLSVITLPVLTVMH